MIAQLAALKHPARVASLTVISSSPFGQDTSTPPATSPTYMEHAERFGALDWTDRGRVIDLMVEDSRQLAGSVRPFDEARARGLIERDVDRARNYASIANHFMLEGGDAWKGRLGEITAPLLVIHGTDDPIFPVENGAALAQAVRGSSLVRLEGGGHELNEAHWDRIVAAIVQHSGRWPTHQPTPSVPAPQTSAHTRSPGAGR